MITTISIVWVKREQSWFVNKNNIKKTKKIIRIQTNGSANNEGCQEKNRMVNAILFVLDKAQSVGCMNTK